VSLSIINLVAAKLCKVGQKVIQAALPIREFPLHEKAAWLSPKTFTSFQNNHSTTVSAICTPG
jgi:hypothetical protein